MVNEEHIIAFNQEIQSSATQEAVIDKLSPFQEKSFPSQTYIIADATLDDMERKHSTLGTGLKTKATICIELQ